MNVTYHTETILSGLPPEIGYYLHALIYLEPAECLSAAAVTTAGSAAATLIPYAGAVLSGIFAKYAVEIVTKNQGSGVDVDLKLPIVAASGLAACVNITTHKPVDASSFYEGRFTDIRVAVSANALDNATTPDGWVRLGVDLNMGAGGKYLYFEILPLPPAPVYSVLSRLKHSVVGAVTVGPLQPHLPVQPQSVTLNQFPLDGYTPPVPQNCISNLAVQHGNSANLQPPSGYTQVGVDLNMGSGGEYIYVSYLRGAIPLKGVAVIASSVPQSSAPAGFTIINVDLNKGAGGKYIYLCYK